MSEKKKKLFPKLKKKISDFLTDESWEITKKDALGIAAGATVFASFQTVDARWWRDWIQSDDYSSLPWLSCSTERERIRGLENEVSDLENEVYYLERKVSNLQEKNNDLEEKIRKSIEEDHDWITSSELTNEEKKDEKLWKWSRRTSTKVSETSNELNITSSDRRWNPISVTLNVPSTHVSWIVNWHMSSLPFKWVTVQHWSHGSHGSHGSHWSRW